MKRLLSFFSALQEVARRGPLYITVAAVSMLAAVFISGYGVIYYEQPLTAFSRTSASCEPSPLEKARLEEKRAKEARERDEQYLFWGRKLWAVNPGLSDEEVYEIGRAVTRYSGEYGLSERLVVAIITVESSGIKKAVSRKGARGLMQVMPWWKQELGIEGDLFDIDTNIRVGCRILSENIRRWGHKEGILRYYRGGSVHIGDGYFVKVQKVLDGLS